MKFDIVYQESYSRGQLLLRSFFGVFYILIPHAFVLYFLAIWSSIINFIAFWSILFTGKYPRDMFEFQKKFIRWQLRVNARLMNLADGYPQFGLEAKDDAVIFEIEYPERLSAGSLILRVLFGVFYVIIPHLFVLSFRFLVSYVLIFVAWWAVLFTGKYPEGMFKFNVGTLRWNLRLQLFMQYFMTDKYPPFNGLPDEEIA
jgi:hypothetical protein